MDKAQALHSFWSSFGIPAYDENTVDPDAVMPYITYEASTDSFDKTLPLTASIWYHSTSWAAISQKADEIATAISYGGVMQPFDGGAVWIGRGSPFAQRMGDDSDSNIRRIVLNITAEFISEN